VVGLPCSLVSLNHSAEDQNEDDLVSADSEYFPFPIKRENSVSSESFPGPKINISRPTNRKINGSAPENFPGFEKNARNDSLSAVKYAMVISITRPKAAILDSNPKASRIPAKNSKLETNAAVNAGAGNPRLEKNSVTCARL